MARRDGNGGSGGGAGNPPRGAAFADSSFLFGGNAAYIEQLYAAYKTNPAAVDPEWREFFGGLNDDDESVAANARGASWKRPNWPKPPEGDLVAALDGQWPVDDKAIADKIKNRAAREGKGEISPADVRRATHDSVRAIMMIRAYRVRGHLHANLDPLGLDPQKDHEELHPASYGFTEADYDRKIFIDGVLGLENATIREMLAILRRTYCAHDRRGSSCIFRIRRRKPGSRAHRRTAEGGFLHPGRQARHPAEAGRGRGLREVLRRPLHRHQAFRPGWRRITIPALEQIIKRGGALGVKEIVIGMPHRGRLNILCHVKKPHRALFSEFKGGSLQARRGARLRRREIPPRHLDRPGDRRAQRASVADRQPVASRERSIRWWSARCAPTSRTCDRRHHGRRSVMALLMHGDAAFAGQGLVAECFGMASSSATAPAARSMSSSTTRSASPPVRASPIPPYPTDVAKIDPGADPARQRRRSGSGDLLRPDGGRIPHAIPAATSCSTCLLPPPRP